MENVINLIQRLRDYVKNDRFRYLQPSTLLTEAADALERLTAGDAVIPRMFQVVHMGLLEDFCTKSDVIDYGNRRAAAAVLAERKRHAFKGTP